MISLLSAVSAASNCEAWCAKISMAEVCSRANCAGCDGCSKPSPLDGTFLDAKNLPGKERERAPKNARTFACAYNF